VLLDSSVTGNAIYVPRVSLTCLFWKRRIRAQLQVWQLLLKIPPDD